MNLIRYYKEKGYLVVMATAAPDHYAARVAAMARITACLATPSRVTDAWEELRCLHKHDVIQDFLESSGAGLAAVIAWHFSDIPLLRLNEGRNIMVSPSPRTLDLLESANIRHEVIDRSLISWQSFTWAVPSQDRQ